MSLKSQSRLFLESLDGKTAVFRLTDRTSNLRFARSVLRLLAGFEAGCALLDLDAFYSSNMDIIAAGMKPESLDRVGIVMPEPGSDAEAALSSLFRRGSDGPILIDSVNSLYQLMSLRNPRSAGRKFAFVVSALADWAKSSGKPVIASIYERRPATHRRPTRSLTDRFDVSVAVSAETGGLSLRRERGGAWRDGSLFLPFEDGKVEAHEDRSGDKE